MPAGPRVQSAGRAGVRNSPCPPPARRGVLGRRRRAPRRRPRPHGTMPCTGSQLAGRQQYFPFSGRRSAARLTWCA